MDSIRIKSLKIADLLLNLENPRFDAVQHQREALNSMISTQVSQEKTRYLAQDIVEGGINLAELVMVTPEGHNKYKVLEGNRRIAALKFLANPDIFKDTHKAFTKQMRILAGEFRKMPIKKIQCVIFPDASMANRWIKLKHTGENKGRGTVPWDAQQVARFESMIAKKSSVGLQAIDFIKDFADEALLSKIKRMPITNLERLLTDKNIQSVLGITVEDGVLKTELLKEEVKKGLYKVVKDVAEKKLKVKDIYDKEDRKNYIETFQPKKDIPDISKKSDNVWSLSLAEMINQPAIAKAKHKSVPISTSRSTLIPRNCILTIKQPKINKIYLELKNLSIDEFSNASGILFRVFLEMSTNVFIDKYNLAKVKKNGDALSLRDKLINVESYMQKNGIATKDELKGVRVMAKTKDNLYSIDTFNDYVHNHHFSPDPTSLKTSWDNVQLFIEKIWGNI